MSSDFVTKRRGRLDAKNETNDMLRTPSRRIRATEPKTPVSAIKNLENALTPRRSGRKSVKPSMDYNDIVNKSALRSYDSEMSQSDDHKWSPSKVGRVSQKRSARKGRSLRNKKLAQSSEETECSVADGSDDKDNQNKSMKLEDRNTEMPFDKENNDKVDENKETPQLQEGNIDEILNTTFDKVNDKEEENEEISQLKEANIEEVLNATFDKANDKEEENEEIPQLKEAKIEEVLNATFDKGNNNEEEKDVIAQLKVVNIEKVLNTTYEMDECLQNADQKQNGKNVLKELEVELESSLPSKNIVKEKSNPPLIKLIEEGNDLGCTPIFYDDTIEPEDGTKKGEIEKEKGIGEEDFDDDDVFEENAERSISKQSCEETKKLNEVEKVKLEQNDSIQYEHIEVLSDDEMSILILSDDEGEEEDANGNVEAKESINNTFNTSDCIEIFPTENSLPKIQLPGNQIQSAPKIVLTNEKNARETLLSTPRSNKNHKNIATPLPAEKSQSLIPISASKRQENATPVSKRKRPMIASPASTSKRQVLGTPSASTSKRQVLGTPSASTSKEATKKWKGYRFPTPFKPRNGFHFVGNESKSDLPQAPLSLTTLEPSEIVLRSIRKRSLSVTIDGDQRKRRALNVTFHSPANQTVTTADLDEMLFQNAAKVAKNKTHLHERLPHRKRSFSFDENYIRHQPSKLPRPVLKSPLKPKTTAPPAARKKVPNFEAIHQKAFAKMENIADYVARKAERAQNLTNSALKARKAADPSPASKNQESNTSENFPVPPTNMDASSSSNAAKKLPLTSDKNSQLKKKTNDENKSFSETLKRRNQRHMEMYKARGGVSAKSATRKNAEIIRGVRSNRRFELMMEHRNLNSANGK